jgi:hypothetical protein
MPERTVPTLDVVLVTGPFDAALRAAVRGRGLTLDRLRAHLARRGVPIALSTLSDWQHGKRRPAVTGSLRTVEALEDVLGLRPGTLVRLLVDPTAKASVRRAHRGRGLDDRSGDLAGLLDRIPGARATSSDMVSDHQAYTIGPDRRLATLWCRKVIRARYDGVDRYILRYFGDPGCDADKVEIRPVHNCWLGQVVRGRSGIVVAELQFGETLHAGDTWVFEIEIADPTGKPTTECAHGFRAPDQQYLMEVRFDPATLPVDCHSFAQTDLYECRQRTGDLVLNRHHALHLMTGGLAGGVVGIGWRWP